MKTFNSKQAVSVVRKGAGLLAGAIAGAATHNFIQKRRQGVAGEEVNLLGLNGKTSKYVTPAIVTAAGIAVNMFANNQDIKNVGMGMVVSGGIGIAQAVSDKNLMALSGAADAPLMPGVGNITNYDQLPSANSAEQTFVNSHLQPVGDVDYADNYEDSVAGDSILL